jgi:hypothetical protein
MPDRAIRRPRGHARLKFTSRHDDEPDMRASAWRKPRLASAWAAAAVLTVVAPPAAAHALPGPGSDRVEPALPSAGELTDLGENGAVPNAVGDTVDGVLQTVEQTGVDVPELPGQPSAATPPETPAGSAPGDGATSSVPPAAAQSPAPTPPATPSADEAGGTPNTESPAATGRPEPGGDSVEPARDGPRPTAVEAGPATTRTETTGGFFQVFGELPWTLLFAAIALALLGLLMTGRSAGLAMRGKRLSRQRQELRQDVGALQTALLPTIPERIGDVRVSVAYEADTGPAAGGDFHDVLRLDDHRLAVIVGDVCGHGREALTITALVHYTVRAYLEAGLEPRDALRLADEAIGDKLGSDFATVVAAIYDSSSSTLRYSVAGHPPPVIVGEGRDHAVAAMTPPPIGVGPGTGTRQTEIEIEPGSGICFVTDGLLEARSGDDGLLAREGLVELLGSLPKPLEGRAVLERVEAEAATADDLTACVLEPLGATGSGAVIEEIDLEPGDDDHRLAAFLEACELDRDQMRQICEAARGHAGGVRLRVRRACGSVDWEILTPGDHRDRVLLAPDDRFDAGSQGTRGNGNGASASDHRAHGPAERAAVGGAARA